MLGFPRKKTSYSYNSRRVRLGAEYDLSTTGNVTLPNSADSLMLVQEYRNLTVNTGHILTPQYRCKGLLLIIHGDLVVNGEITMTARGAAGTPASTQDVFNPMVGKAFDVTYPYNAKSINTYLKNNLSPLETVQQTLNRLLMWPTIISMKSTLIKMTFPIDGANGGASVTNTLGNDGYAGTGRQTGGGGSGNGYYQGSNGIGGAGAKGQLWGGGPGGGGGHGWASSNSYGIVGGAGGAGTGDYQAAGGAGNPGGAGDNGGGTGGNGVGGLLIICCGGSVTINYGGKITAYGMPGGDQSNSAGGGGSGGGSINIVYSRNYTNNGTVSAAGGRAGIGYTSGTHNGGAGGAGAVTVEGGLT